MILGLAGCNTAIFIPSRIVCTCSETVFEIFTTDRKKMHKLYAILKVFMNSILLHFFVGQKNEQSVMQTNKDSISVLEFSVQVWKNTYIAKGQTSSKWFFQADVSSKKRTNKLCFTTCRLVFVRILEESEETRNTFQNKLTFRRFLSNNRSEQFW